jgi:stearoyl-CoA desaturase (delta-9 desaturase)
VSTILNAVFVQHLKSIRVQNPTHNILSVSGLVSDEAAHKPSASKKPQPAGLLVQILNFVVIVAPFIGLIYTMYLTWGWGVGWLELTTLAITYALTGFGITVGFHRLFTHRSFETNIVAKAIWGILGSAAAQGTIFDWVACHRKHHQHSDHDEDPHSPHHHGGGVKGLLLGFAHAHLVWVFRKEPIDYKRYVKDLMQSPTLRIVNNLFLVWVLLGLVLPALAVGLITMSWKGALLGFLWGGPVRMFLVHHVTWCVNSVCHMWGQQPYKNIDESRNNAIFGVLAMGEGWHNNHHAFPTSARHGLRWWQFDSSYTLIQLMQAVGLAWKIKLPSERDLELRREQTSGLAH